MLIENIGTYIPKGFVSNESRLEKFGLKESFLTNKIGVSSTSRAGESEGVVELSVGAINNLLTKCNLELNSLDVLVLCTQNPDNCGLPHNSAILHGVLELPKTCVCFDISLGCSGYVYGLSVVQAMLTHLGLSKGLLVTCDPYSKIIDENDKNTSLLFGDAATATLISPDGSWKTGKYNLGTDGSSYEAIQTVAETGKFSMNGRKVYEFALSTVPESIKFTLKANNLVDSDIETYLLHQGSKYMISQIASHMGIEAFRMPFLCAEYGNSVSSSIPMLLADRIDNNGILLLSGFGVGLSWGSVPLYRI